MGIFIHPFRTDGNIINRYSIDDQEIASYVRSFEYLWKAQSKLALIDLVPFARLFLYNVEKEMRINIKRIKQSFTEKYFDRLHEHERGVIHDFCDSLIEAKLQAITEAKECAEYLTYK